MASSDKVNLLGKREPEDDLETKPILKKHKENSEEENKEQIKGTVELLETKSDQAPVKETVEGLDETPDSVEVPKKYMSGLLIRCFPSRKKTLYVCCLPRDTKMPDIIDFFKDVGQVVSVQLTTKRNGLRLSTGFVEFASANEAKKALDMKNGEYLCGNKLILGMASCENIAQPKYCIYHKVW
jgi:polyadenylate-binding protein